MLGRILLALILAAAVIGVLKREQITRLLAVNSLFSQEKIVSNFSHMDAAFLTTSISRDTGPVSDLPNGVVIVATSADRLFKEPGVSQGNVDTFRKIAQSLN